MNVALLNSTDEAVVARAMIRIVEERLADTERQLTQLEMDREGYLKAFSRANVLREVLEEHQKLYRRAFVR